MYLFSICVHVFVCACQSVRACGVETSRASEKVKLILR